MHFKPTATNHQQQRHQQYKNQNNCILLFRKLFLEFFLILELLFEMLLQGSSGSLGFRNEAINFVFGILNGEIPKDKLQLDIF